MNAGILVGKDIDIISKRLFDLMKKAEVWAIKKERLWNVIKKNWKRR